MSAEIAFVNLKKLEPIGKYIQLIIIKEIKLGNYINK